MFLSLSAKHYPITDFCSSIMDIIDENTGALVISCDIYADWKSFICLLFWSHCRWFAMYEWYRDEKSTTAEEGFPDFSITRQISTCLDGIYMNTCNLHPSWISLQFSYLTLPVHLQLSLSNILLIPLGSKSLTDPSTIQLLLSGIPYQIFLFPFFIVASQTDSLLNCFVCLKQFLCQAICTQRTSKGPKWLKAQWTWGLIYIRHCQASSQFHKQLRTNLSHWLHPLYFPGMTLWNLTLIYSGNC